MKVIKRIFISLCELRKMFYLSLNRLWNLLSSMEWDLKRVSNDIQELISILLRTKMI